MCPGHDDEKPGPPFDYSDDDDFPGEDTNPNADQALQGRLHALRETVTDARLELLRNSQVTIGKRLSALEVRLDMLVHNLVDIAASDQVHDERLAELQKGLIETRKEVRKLVAEVEDLKYP